MEELAIVCARARCDGIVLSMSMEPQSEWLEQALPQLVAKVGKPVFVGGRAAAAHGDAIARAAAVAIGADISNGLRRILSGAGHTHPQARRVASALGSSI